MPFPEIQILVCTNERPPDADRPCCSRRGSMELYRAFKDRVKELGLRDRVLITRTGCLKHCSQGITVGVWPANLWYRRVTTADIEAILDQALRGTAPPQRILLPEGAPWE